MISNRVRRNIWLAITVSCVLVLISRIVRYADGSVEWWQVLSPAVILACSLKFYLSYRKQVKQGNLFGHVDPLDKKQ